jgi:phenylacetate-CoA ligase
MTSSTSPPDLIDTVRSFAYRSTFSPAGQRIFDLLMRKGYRAAYAWLMRTQWLSRREVRALQLSQLKDLLEHAYSYSSFHRDRLRAAGWKPGAAVDFETLGSLPVLERVDLQERLDEVATVRRWRAPRLSVARSGGTTSGTPLKTYVDGLSHDRKSAVWPRNESWVGLRPGDRQVVVGGFSRGLNPSLPLRARVQDWLRNRSVVLLWTFDEASLERCVRALEERKPKYLAAFPSGLYALATFLRANSRRLRIPVVYATGEMMYPEWRDLVLEYLGDLFCEAYGAAEASHIALTCAACGVLHVNDENILVETEPGTGEILITDLTNRATPLIRYRVGDRGELAEGPAACGRGLSSLLRVHGRTADVLDLGGGKKVTGVVFPTVMLNYTMVRGYQVWQPEPRRLQLLVQGPPDAPASAICADLRRLIPSASIEVIAVDDIPPTDAGKRPVIVPGRAYRGPGRVLVSSDGAPLVTGP